MNEETQKETQNYIGEGLKGRVRCTGRVGVIKKRLYPSSDMGGRGRLRHLTQRLSGLREGVRRVSDGDAYPEHAQELPSGHRGFNASRTSVESRPVPQGVTPSEATCGGRGHLRHHRWEAQANQAPETVCSKACGVGSR